jgi:hypothetical protein
MVLVLVTNHSALMHPHPFANDAVWGAHSGNIGKSARLPAFSRRILLGIGKLTVFAYASAINFVGRCESFLDAGQTALGIRES